MIWERKTCVAAQVEDALVLLDLETLKYHSLNPTAAAVWELLAEPADEDALVAGLCARYDIGEEQCRQSVTRLLGQLEASQLIAPQENASAGA